MSLYNLWSQLTSVRSSIAWDLGQETKVSFGVRMSLLDVRVWETCVLVNTPDTTLPIELFLSLPLTSITSQTWYVVLGTRVIMWPWKPKVSLYTQGAVYSFGWRRGGPGLGWPSGRARECSPCPAHPTWNHRWPSLRSKKCQSSN